MFVFGLIFFIFSFYPLPYMNGIFCRQLLGLELLGLLIGTLLVKKFTWSLGILFVFIFSFGLIKSGVHWGPDLFSLDTLISASVKCLLSLVLFSCAALLISNEQSKIIIPCLALVAFCEIPIIIWRGISNYLTAWWVIGNGSLDASFVALLLPAMLECKRFKSLILICVVGALIVSRSNTALFTPIVLLCAYAFAKKDHKKILLIVGTTLCVFCVGHFILGNKFLASEGRFGEWQLAMSYWWHNINPWIGSGPGTFCLHIQIINKGQVFFPWLHSDWLQMLFEEGFVGLALVIVLFATMLKRSFKNTKLFAMNVGYGFVALTQFPLHIFHLQLLGLGLIYETFML